MSGSPIDARDPFVQSLVDAQDAALDASSHLERARDRLVSGAPAIHRPVNGRLIALSVGSAGLLAAAAATVIWIGVQPVPITATIEGERLMAGAWIDRDQAARVDFSDGTVLHLNAGTRARVATLDAEGAEIVIEDGMADLDVVHTDRADWKVMAGPFRVDVTGTRFRTAWDADAEVFLLDMQEGSVWVTGPKLGDGTALSGDQQPLEVRLAVVEETPSTGTPVPDEAEPPELVVDAGPATQSVLPVAEAEPGGEADLEPTWLDLATSGRFEAAVAAASAEGLDGILSTSGSGELYQLGRAATLSQQGEMAHRVYETLRDRHAGTKEATSAAFHLGQAAGTPDRRARWFKTAYEEARLRGGSGDAGDQAEMALGYWMEAADAARDRSAARDAAAEYKLRYPDGQWSSLANKLDKGRAH